MKIQPRRATTRAHRRVGVLVALVVTMGGLALATPATANQGTTTTVIRAWNADTLAALTNTPAASTPGAGQAPPVGGIHTAMVHIAVFDAVNSIVGTYQPYLDGLPEAPGWASVDAAAATAAHDVLMGLGRAPVPALPDPVRGWIALRYAETLGGIPDGEAKAEGIAAGANAAAAMLASRDGDGRYVPAPFTEGTGRGEWRPTSGVNDPNGWVRNVTPFTLNSSDQFLTKGPTRPRQPRLRPRVRRGQVARLPHREQPQRRATSDRRLLPARPGRDAPRELPWHHGT